MYFVNYLEGNRAADVGMSTADYRNHFARTFYWLSGPFSFICDVLPRPISLEL